jgi:putative transposase
MVPRRSIYSEINLHITWHIKASIALLTGKIEDRVHHYLKHSVIATGGVTFHEIGGTETHIHLVVSVPPTLLVSDWIGKLKGSSSFYINQEIANRKLLEWQDGYGVVSFGTRDLEWVKSYVRNQREHHARGTTQERLERIEGLKPEEEQGR